VVANLSGLKPGLPMAEISIISWFDACVFC
jgi:hypothetical protein